MENPNTEQDVAVNLVKTLAQHAETFEGPVTQDWEAMTIIVDSFEGDFNSAAGYFYTQDGTPIAVSANPREVLPVIDAYVRTYYKADDALPVKFLVQLHRPSGQYRVTFEDTDETRWKVSPATIATIREDLRPKLDEEGSLEALKI